MCEVVGKNYLKTLSLVELAERLAFFAPSCDVRTNDGNKAEEYTAGDVMMEVYSRIKERPT